MLLTYSRPLQWDSMHTVKKTMTHPVQPKGGMQGHITLHHRELAFVHFNACETGSLSFKNVCDASFVHRCLQTSGPLKLASRTLQ